MKYALLVDYNETIEFKGIFPTYKQARENGNTYNCPYFIMEVSEITDHTGKLVEQ